MASPARSRIRKISSAKTAPAFPSREEQILNELESFFQRHIDAMSPSQLRQYKGRSAEILAESRSRRESVSTLSTRGKEQSSLKARAR
jgi:hypothetical protein